MVRTIRVVQYRVARGRKLSGSERGGSGTTFQVFRNNRRFFPRRRGSTTSMGRGVFRRSDLFFIAARRDPMGGATCPPGVERFSLVDTRSFPTEGESFGDSV